MADASSPQGRGRRRSSLPAVKELSSSRFLKQRRRTRGSSVEVVDEGLTQIFRKMEEYFDGMRDIVDQQRQDPQVFVILREQVEGAFDCVEELIGHVATYRQVLVESSIQQKRIDELTLGNLELGFKLDNMTREKEYFEQMLEDTNKQLEAIKDSRDTLQDKFELKMREQGEQFSLLRDEFEAKTKELETDPSKHDHCGEQIKEMLVTMDGFLKENEELRTSLGAAHTQLDALATEYHKQLKELNTTREVLQQETKRTTDLALQVDELKEILAETTAEEQEERLNTVRGNIRSLSELVQKSLGYGSDVGTIRLVSQYTLRSLKTVDSVDETKEESPRTEPESAPPKPESPQPKRATPQPKPETFQRKPMPVTPPAKQALTRSKESREFSPYVELHLPRAKTPKEESPKELPSVKSPSEEKDVQEKPEPRRIFSAPTEDVIEKVTTATDENVARLMNEINELNKELTSVRAELENEKMARLLLADKKVSDETKLQTHSNQIIQQMFNKITALNEELTAVKAELEMEKIRRESIAEARSHESESVRTPSPEPQLQEKPPTCCACCPWLDSICMKLFGSHQYSDEDGLERRQLVPDRSTRRKLDFDT